jgi:hypothetical protein
MPPRGGIRQRLAAAPHEDPDTQVSTDPPILPPRRGGHLAHCLLHLHGWGLLSAPSLQLIAAAAVADGLDDAEVASLARAGSEGRYVSNIDRDIFRHVGQVDTPELYTARVPAQDREGVAIEADAQLLLPHDLFSFIANSRPELFSSFTFDGELEAFWNRALETGDPQLHGHPVLDRPGWRSRAVPLLVYGDGANYTTRESVEIAAWGALSCRRNTWQSRYLMTGWVKSACSPHPRHTWEELWRILCWSFNSIFLGVHPSVDHRGDAWGAADPRAALSGTPLTPNGFFGVVHGVCGDMDYFRSRLQFREFAPNSANPCALCRANRTTAPFKDLTPTAAWLATIKRPPEHILTDAAFFGLPGVSGYTLRLDVMHVLDLGVVAHYVGNVFFLLIYDAELPGATIADRTKFLWVLIRELYSQLGSTCRMGHPELSVFCDPSRPHIDFPFSKLKAAENRDLIAVAVELCKRFGADTPRGRVRLEVGQHFARFLDLIRAGGPILSAPAATEASASLLAALENYARLNAHAAMELHRPLFNVVNKHHFAAHLARQLRWLNPSYASCYSWEDLIGRAKKVAFACRDGTRAVQIGPKLMTRYRRVLAYELA